jgi:RNA polymerase subunit RPABC4/transcription elongation factor Spt4
MIRQEMTVCQKCGAVKEIGEPCDCSEEEKNEDEWWGFNIILPSYAERHACVR